MAGQTPGSWDPAHRGLPPLWAHPPVRSRKRRAGLRAGPLGGHPRPLQSACLRCRGDAVFRTAP
eukprot:2725008-Alexandrium_andersonii.AAC.1